MFVTTMTNYQIEGLLTDCMSWDSNWLWAGQSGFDSQRGWEFISSRPALGPTRPPIKWVPGALSLGVKRLRHEADHSPPSSAKVKYGWAIPPRLQYVFMTWYLVKHRDIFTFTLLTVHDCLDNTFADTFYIRRTVVAQ
jgi:hypothetical protein